MKAPGFRNTSSRSQGMRPPATSSGKASTAICRHFARVAAISALALAAMLHWQEPALAQDAQALYEQGVQARQAGKLQEAEQLFSRGLAARPDDVDMMLQQGLTLAALGRDDEASRLFSEVLQRAPGYTDAALALSRIDARHDRSDEALARTRRLLAEHPKDPALLEMQADLLLRQGHATQSEAGYRDLLARDPGNAPALMGLGNSLREQGRDAEARKAYQQASAAGAGPLAAERANWPLRTRFRLDAGVGYSRLSGDRPSWKDGTVRLAYNLSPATTISGGMDVARRFDHTDTYGEARIDHRFNERLNTYALAGLSPGARFLPRTALGLGGEYRLNSAAGPGATHAALDLRYAHYASGNVWTANAGIVQYFANDRAWVRLMAINALDENSRYLGGFSVRADWQAQPRLRLFAGYANAPESSDGVTVRTRSVFGGAAYDFTETFSATLTVAHEDRRDLYRRASAGLGLTYRF